AVLFSSGVLQLTAVSISIVIASCILFIIVSVFRGCNAKLNRTNITTVHCDNEVYISPNTVRKAVFKSLNFVMNSKLYIEMDFKTMLQLPAMPTTKIIEILQQIVEKERGSDNPDIPQVRITAGASGSYAGYFIDYNK